MQITTKGNNGVELEEYQGTYSLAATYEGKDGTARKEWALKQMGKDKYAEKATPIKVILGDKATAIGVLQTLLKELGGSTPVDKHDVIGGDDDVPFL